MTESWVLGLDVGGTNLKAAAVGRSGAIFREFSQPIEGQGTEAWDSACLNLLKSWENSLGPAKGAAVAAPGLPDREGRSIAWMAGPRGDLVGVCWADVLQMQAEVPVLNDARAALLGEQWMGAAKGQRNCILLTLGTGVGGAAIVDGHMAEGAIGRAGHFGHISLDPWGPKDVSGMPGSLETAIGNASVPDRTHGAFSSTEALVMAAQEGPGEAREAWLRSVRNLGCGIASLVNVLDPDLVILGGGIAKAGRFLLEPLQAVLDEVEWRPLGSGARVVLAELGGMAGAIGAARRGWTAMDEGEGA